MSAAVSTAPAAKTTAPAATATALLLWTGFVDHQITAGEVLPIQSIDRAIGFFVVVDFNERETARLARETITNQIDRGRINT